MPLPTRAPSQRSTVTEPKTTVSRLSRPTTTSNLSKSKVLEAKTKTSHVQETPEIEPSTTSTKGSTNGSQASSRIPSPFKRNPSSQSSHSSYVKPVSIKPPERGHVRQRSAVTPLLSAPQKFTHSRSASAVSVNTTVSTSSNDATKSTPKHQLGPSAYRSGPSKLRAVPAQPQPHSLPTIIRPASTYAHTESVQNELLQLAAVYKQSSHVMQAYQRSIEQFLATKQADIVAKRAIVQGRKRSFCAALNLLGLDHWLSLEGSQKTSQYLQNLSIAVKDLQNLESIFEGSDGLAAAFRQWQQAICYRKDQDTILSSELISHHTVFEHRLAPEIRRFKQQVSSALASLSNLPDCPPDTTLSSAIKGHVNLATSLIAQCQIMLQIGDLLVVDHCQWLRAEVKTAVMRKDSLSEKSLATTQLRPAWDM